MGKLTEQIQSLGYHFLEGKPLMSVPAGAGFTEIRQLSVRALDGQIMEIKRDTSPTLFPGGPAYRQGVLDGSLADGLKTSCDAIYRDYYSLDDNGHSLLFFNYSARTKQYLDAEKARIGLISYKEGIPEGFFALDQYAVGQGIGEMDIGHYADGRFVAQSAHPLFEEEYVLRMHFSRFPSKQDVEDAVVIRKMERDFKLGRHREIFICNDCGETKHWLDIPGSISEKLRLRLQRKCGCVARK